MNLSDFEFDKCRYNPRDKNFIGQLQKDIPEFKQTNIEQIKPVFTYIVLMYDKESPFQRKYTKYYERKVRCADVAGMPKDGRGGFSKFTKEVLEGLNQDVNKLKVAYLANSGDIEFMMLINEWAMFQGFTALTMSGSFDDKTFKTLDSISRSIKERTRQVFGSGENDELAKVRTLLYEQAEKDRHRLNIENVVQIIADQGDVPEDWNRYNKGYIVDQLKFVDNK